MAQDQQAFRAEMITRLDQMEQRYERLDRRYERLVYWILAVIGAAAAAILVAFLT